MKEFTHSITIKEPGYLLVFLSNESETSERVFFDELTVALTQPIIQVDDYYPFGMSISGLSASRENSLENKYLYNNKELQTDFDLGWYDYGARMYQADLGRFGSIDPKADKYYGISSYVYVADNPVIYIDPDGEEIIVFSTTKDNSDYVYKSGQKYEGSDPYIKKVVDALNYLSDGSENAKSLIDNLENDEEFSVYVVNSESMEMESDPFTGVIDFNANSGLNTENGVQSPAIGLAHELGHQQNIQEEGTKTVRDRFEEKDAQYDNKEERKVISEVEQPIVKELNENGNNEAIRYDHKGREIPVSCSTCNY